MKAASGATIGILASGEWLLAELFDITLATGQVYRFTSFDAPISAAIYPSATKNTYLTGLTIVRDALKQSAGTQAGSMKLLIAPQPDSPNAPILIAGYPILQAARYGFMAGATVLMSKLFMNFPAPGALLDTSPGAVAWFKGTMQTCDFDRLSLEITVEDYLTKMAIQQMPRQLYGAGCFHTVYDAGCTLLRTSFTSSGTVATVGDSQHLTTNLTQADDYYDLGVITMTSGANNGLSANVSTYKNASGAITLRFPFPALCSPGDTFSIYPGCDLQQSTCTNKFSNLAHFSGVPYTPVPETILDGGTDVPPTQTPGAQAGQIIGSGQGGKVAVPPYTY